MFPVLEKIQKIGIVPVVVLDDAKDACPLAQALIEGGLPCAEVTFRTAAAEESIKAITSAYPDMLVGAGTVLSVEQTKRAVAAGAQFIVCPGLDTEIVGYCLENGIAVIPGASTPTEVEAAYKLGLDTVKFFPAEAAGGIKMIKAMAAPFTTMHFMPTGGVNADNLNSYLSFNKIVACGGSWMVNKKLINEGNFDEIKRLTREAVYTMLGFEFGHLGINNACEKCAGRTSSFLSDVFGFGVTKEGAKSIFNAGIFECMKYEGPGAKGHLAIATNNVERAVYFLKNQGIEFNEETATYKDGKMNFIYLKDELAGFGVHLVQK